MSPLILQAQPLTAEAFAPFGEVIEAAGDSYPINAGTCQRFHDLAPVDVLEQEGRPLINIFRSQPVTLPVTLRLMERHPLSSQAFVPLDNRPWLAVVAPPGDDLPVSSLRAFIANGRQGVSYRRGVWHHPLLALLEVSDFLVVDRGGSGENCDERPLEGVEVRVEV